MNYFYNCAILIYVINIFHLIPPKGKKAIHLFDKANTEKNLIEISNENIRFKEGNIASLKKYLFPSLTPDIAYLMSIIDYFQVYNIQKDLENKYKKIRSGVKREAISSIPPDEYKKRFYDFIKQKTDSEHFLKRIYDPENKNDF